MIVILDSCYSGEFIQSKGTNGAILEKARANLINKEIMDAFKAASSSTPQSGAVMAKSLNPTTDAQFHVITGCGNNQLSYYGPGIIADLWGDNTYRSLLTYAIEEGTSGTKLGVLQADKDGDKAVSMNELYQYTKPRVQELLSKGSSYIQDVQMWSQNAAFAMFAMN